jgi:hypothetical protein
MPPQRTAELGEVFVVVVGDQRNQSAKVMRPRVT